MTLNIQHGNGAVVQHLYHVVDLDIKGFFDNISHTKLIRQIWALGIRDKKLLCIIKEMLKAPVVLPDGKKTYPARGTPQGGILSPLLANIVLNELDWWIASQWEEMPTKTKFKTRSNAQGTEIKSHAYRALRRSRLKEMHPVKGRTIEYADNRISLYAAQYGKCAVTGIPMDSHDIHCHHKVPVSNGGSDEYANLILVSKAVHILIHASSELTIEKYLKSLNLDNKQIEKLNKLRIMAEMPPIIL